MRLNNKLMLCVGSLKNLSRTGWMLHGIAPSIAESVASHSFEAALISLLLYNDFKKAGYTLDLGKLVSMALLHDITECILGDITANVKNQIGEDVKKEAEIYVVNEIFDEREAEYLRSMLVEFYEEKSLESILAKISDKLSTCVQAKRYILIGYKSAEEIYMSTLNEISKLLSNFEPSIKENVIKICENVY